MLAQEDMDRQEMDSKEVKNKVWVDFHRLFLESEWEVFQEGLNADPNLTELADPQWREMAIKCLVPVAMNEEEK